MSHNKRDADTLDVGGEIRHSNEKRYARNGRQADWRRHCRVLNHITFDDFAGRLPAASWCLILRSVFPIVLRLPDRGAGQWDSQGAWRLPHAIATGSFTRLLVVLRDVG